MAKNVVVSIKNKVDPDPDPVMQLSLKQENGYVLLTGTAADGQDWFIASVTPEGLRIWRDLPNNIGWPIDKYERMKLIDDTTGEPIE